MTERLTRRQAAVISVIAMDSKAEADAMVRRWGAWRLAAEGHTVADETVEVTLDAAHYEYGTLTGCDAVPEVELAGRDASGRRITISLPELALTEIVREMLALSRDQGRFPLAGEPPPSSPPAVTG